MWVVNWDMFGAGMALIGFTILLYFLNGIITSFKPNVRIPWYIPIPIFVIGILLIMQSVGIITGINEYLITTLKNSNIQEVILGFVLVLIILYKPLFERIGVKLSNWLRISFFVFGVILILDGMRILPIIYYLSQLIGNAIYTMAVYLTVYPWLSIIIVLAVIVLISWLYVKISKGGVRT